MRKWLLWVNFNSHNPTRATFVKILYMRSLRLEFLLTFCLQYDAVMQIHFVEL